MAEKEAPISLTLSNLRSLLLVVFAFIIEALAFYFILTIGFGLEAVTLLGAASLYVGGKLSAYLLKLVARG